MITGKKINSLDTQIILTIGGVAAGRGLGLLLTDLKAMKTGTTFEKTHHWVVGLLIAILGVIFAAFRILKESAIFITAVGFGLLLTDLPDMGKQLDNLRDQEPISQGVSNPPYDEYGSEFIELNEN